jgi:hypothetical protein
VHFDIIKVFYSPTDAQVNCLKNNLKLTLKQLLVALTQSCLLGLANFHVSTVNFDIIKVFYSPTDAQVNCLKNNFKIYIKFDIKTAPTYFCAVTPSSGSALISVC